MSKKHRLKHPEAIEPTVPAEGPGHAPQAPAARSFAASTAQKVLLVEDDAINVKFMQVVLTRKGGFEVVVSEDPAEILEIAKAGGLAGIIMDISLARSTLDGQKMDGIGITRLLKADPATAGIPVLIATAHAMFGDRERFIAETGAEGYLAKPFHDPDAFLNEVRRVIPKG